MKRANLVRLPEAKASRWRSDLLAPTLVGIGLRLLLAAAIGKTFLWPDEMEYDRVGRLFASNWHHHIFGNPAAPGWDGSTHFGYPLFVGLVYYVAPSFQLLVIIDAIISGLSALFAGRLGDHFGVGRTAAWLVALYPTAIYWGATALKDGMLATLFLASLAIAFDTESLRRVLLQIGLLAAMATIRPELAGVALAVEVVSLLTQERATSAMKWMIGGGIATALACSALFAMPVLHDKLYGLATLVASGQFGLAPLIHSDLARALFGPFSSHLHGLAISVVGEFPGQLLYVPAVPAAMIGAGIAWRQSARARALVIGLAMYFLGYLSEVIFNGGFFRQRFPVELIILILAAHALRQRRALVVRVSLAWVPIAIALQFGKRAALAAAVVVAGIALWRRWHAGLEAHWPRISAVPRRDPSPVDIAS